MRALSTGASGSLGRDRRGFRVIRSIVFDLDGTLIDSQADLASATNALLEELGGVRLADTAIAAMVGEGAAVLVRRALTAAALDPEASGALDRFLALYDARLLDRTVAYGGIPEALDTLGVEVPLSVLTNKPLRAAERILEGLGLRRHFRHVVGGDSPFGRKPDPAALLHLVRATGATPATTVLVGDSPIDLATARNAGTLICLARYGFGYRFDRGDLTGGELFIDRPAELLSVTRPLR